jgi:hypothetical protein
VDIREMREERAGENTSEEFRNLYFSLVIVRAMKLRRMESIEHVDCMVKNDKCIPNFGRKTLREEATR